MTDHWTIEFYADENGREPCRVWMEKLGRVERIALETAIDLVLAERGLGVCSTEYGKALGDGLYEFRLRWTADEVRAKVGRVTAEKSGKILLRVFFCTSGQKIILLLSGYDKARNSGSTRQQKEIDKARKVLTAHREAEKRDRKRSKQA